MRVSSSGSNPPNSYPHPCKRTVTIIDGESCIGGGGVDGMVIPMIRSDLRQIGMGCFAYTFLLQVQSENDDLNYVFQVYFMF